MALILRRGRGSSRAHGLAGAMELQYGSGDRPLVLFLEAETARARTGYALLLRLVAEFQPSDPDIPHIISLQQMIPTEAQRNRAVELSSRRRCPVPLDASVRETLPPYK